MDGGFNPLLSPLDKQTYFRQQWRDFLFCQRKREVRGRQDLTGDRSRAALAELRSLMEPLALVLPALDGDWEHPGFHNRREVTDDVFTRSTQGKQPCIRAPRSHVYGQRGRASAVNSKVDRDVQRDNL